MSAVDVVFQDARREVVAEEISFAHLSIEIGHLCREDLEGSDEKLRAHFERTAPWVQTAIGSVRARYGPDARVSTCFLFDDYAAADLPGTALPSHVVTMLVNAARDHDLPLDYIVRESGCALAADTPRASDFHRVPLAEIVNGQLIAEPDEGDNGSRPATSVSGWLSNGRRSPHQGTVGAMAQASWEPPEERGRRRHSIFLDAELWADSDEPQRPGGPAVTREWSCAFLATVWQLLRLGVLRNQGKPVATAYRHDPAADGWPDEWADMPTVYQVTEDAAPFAAYRALSVLPLDHLDVEHAVRVLLHHFQQDEAVFEQAVARAAAEGVILPWLPAARLGYVFVDEV